MRMNTTGRTAWARRKNGTHEFFELCEQLGCKTYVNGNVGSGSVQEMSEWVEYMTLDGVSPMADWRRENGREKPWRVDYFGVGNENWGCGGNMTPDYYAWLYRRYQTYIRCYDRTAPIFKICGGANADDYEWTDTVLRECFRSPAPADAHGFMDGLSVHYYAGVEIREAPQSLAKKPGSIPCPGLTELKKCSCATALSWITMIRRKRSA